MDAITLPVLPYDTPLYSALSVMRGANVAGVVTTNKRNVYLVRALDIYRGLRWNKKTIGDIDSTKIITANMAFEKLSRHRRDWLVATTMSVPTLAVRAYGSRGLDTKTSKVSFAKNEDYSLAAIDIGIATVVTASEQYALWLSGQPTNCYCTGPRQHPHDERPNPPKCKYGDGASVECEE